MTPEQLNEIEKLAEAATPGPWAQEVWQGNDDTGGWAAVGPHQESTDCICESEEDRKFCHGEFCEDDRSQNDQEKALEDAAFIRAMREHALPLVKALRQAWQDREDYRNDAIAAEKECDRMLTSTALLTYLVEELVQVPRNGNRLEKLVEQSRTHLLRLRECEGSDE